MQCIEGGVELHGFQPHFEPGVEFVALDHLEVTATVWHLKDGTVPEAPVFPVNLYESEDGLDRTQEGIGGSSQRDLVDPLPELVVLGLGDRNNNAVIDVVAQRLDILPAEDHLKIDVLERLRDEI